MQIKDRSGIACDQCGTTYKSDFLYYSFDFRLVPVYDNRVQSLKMIFRIQPASSLDICTQCFEDIKTKVICNYDKSMNKNVANRGKPRLGIICEMSGDKMVGTFKYYHCNVTKVDVRMSGQPNICVKCQRQTNDNNEPCKECGGNDFIKLAKTDTNDRHIEINISEQIFRDMVDKAEVMRKTSSEWTTES